MTSETPQEETPLEGADALVAELLQLAEPDRRRRLEQLARERPREAREVRERLEGLASVGLAGPMQGPATTPERLGDYVLLERVGGGGMGVVYRARQESLGREVALKLVRPEHLWFEGVRARFRREVETVARLQHPGIVPVHAVGEVDGVPFFAMELVQGRTLAELLERVRGARRMRLHGRRLAAVASMEPEGASRFAELSWTDACFEVAAQVADALSHAHRHGVLHRDVKPSNVMLDRRGNARLLDFGLATSRHAPKLTRSGSRLGSLEYMSPEQMRGEDLDERTDVYSLGVTLYELLTLREPFQGESTEAVRRAVLAGTPPPPRAIHGAIPADAETVCLKAMSVDRAHRYPSAAAFADDLRRFLRRQPVRARRPGPLLRARRFVQRHPAASVAMLCGFLLVAVLPTALYLNELAARAAIAEEAESASRTADFLVGLFEGLDPEVVRGREVTALELLQRGERRMTELAAARPRIRFRLMLALARTYLGIERAGDAERLARAAVALAGAVPSVPAREMVDARVLLAAALRDAGRLAEAEFELRAALELARRPDGGGPLQVARVLSMSGEVLERAGRREEALEKLRDALAIRARNLPAGAREVTLARIALAEALENGGRHEEAASGLRDAERTLERHDMRNDPLYGRALHALAVVAASRGRFEEADRGFRRAIAAMERIYGKDSVIVAFQLENHGGLLVQRRRFAEAEKVLRRALAIREARLGSRHPGTARALNQLGFLLDEAGRPRDALPILERAVALDRVAHPHGHRDLGVSLHNLGRARLLLGDLDGAAAATSEALHVFEHVPAPEPVLEAKSHRQAAWIHALQGRSEPALEHARLALDRLSGPEAGGNERERALGHDMLAFVRLRFGDARAALDHAERAIATLQETDEGGSLDLALAWHHLGWAHEDLGDLSSAEPAYRHARDMFRRLAPSGTEVSAYTLAALGRIEARKGRWKEAGELLAESLRVRKRLLDANDSVLVRTQANLAVVRLRQKRPDEALALAERALEARGPGRRDPLRADLLETAARAWMAQGDRERALPVARECLALRCRLFPEGHAMRTRTEELVRRLERGR